MQQKKINSSKTYLIIDNNQNEPESDFESEKNFRVYSGLPFEDLNLEILEQENL